MNYFLGFPKVDNKLRTYGSLSKAARVGRALFRACGCTGLNIFQNNGLDAGQHVPHFHVHVVPRYPGSDPRRIFQQADFEAESFEKQIEMAVAVQAALEV
jgi:diadenosine tetraphosphate (Ap4A) HIT family hydrolase